MLWLCVSIYIYIYINVLSHRCLLTINKQLFSYNLAQCITCATDGAVY